MLSKYYQIIDKTDARADAIETSALFEVLKNIYGDVRDLEQISTKGTSGLFFRAVINGKTKFIKTHRNGSMYKKNLQKETKLLSLLYKEELNVASFVMEYDKMERFFLIMDYISVYDKCHSIDAVRSIIQNYQNLFDDPVLHSTINYTMTDVLSVSQNSYDLLCKNHFLSDDSQQYCSQALRRFENYANNCDMTVNHGDLSGINILFHSNNCYLIDWEDALLACRDYDILYWLTFFAQRNLYSNSLFDTLGINAQFGKDVMSCILLVKSALSYLNGSYLKNSMSFDSRIKEVIFI